MVNEKDLLKTIGMDLELIETFNIKIDIFYSDLSRKVFKDMIDKKLEGYKVFEFDSYQQNIFKDSKMLFKENLEGYINTIIDHNQKLRIKDFANTFNSFCDTKDFDPKNMITRLKDKVSEFESTYGTDEEIMTTNDFEEVFKDLQSDTYEATRDTRTQEFPVLDKMMGGWVEDTTHLLAGSSGRGKSSFCINLALNTALSNHFQENDLYVSYFNYEMSPNRFFMRCIMKLAHITKKDLTNKTTEVKTKLKKGYELFKKANLLITHDTPKTMDESKFMIRKLSNEYKVRLIFIDYIGRIVKDSSERQKQEHQLLRDWVIDLSNLRRDISKKHRNGGNAIPFTLFIISQLNREAEISGEANARKHMQGSYSMISELDYLYSIDYVKELGFLLKNDKARDEEDGFWINYIFEKEYQNFIEIGIVDKDKFEKEKKEIKIDY